MSGRAPKKKRQRGKRRNQHSDHAEAWKLAEAQYERQSAAAFAELGGDPLLDINQVARVMGLRPQTLHNWRHRRRGPRGFKLAAGQFGPVRYRLSDVQAWLADPVAAEREAWGDATSDAAAEA